MGIEAFYDTADLHPYDLTGELVQRQEMLGLVNRKPVGRLAVPRYDIELVKGNDRTLRVYVKDGECDIVDLTGAVCVLTVKWSPADAAVITKSTSVPAQGAVTDPLKGECEFYLVPADTNALIVQQYGFDVKVTSSTGKVYTVLQGTMNLLAKVG